MADNNIEEELDKQGPEWGADFNPDQARELITKLRTEAKANKADPADPTTASIISGLQAEVRNLKTHRLTEDEQQQLQELAALKEASRTDAERREAEIAALTEQAGQVPTLSTENLRLQVALEKGLDLTAAKRLQGTTREELEADAEELKTWRGAGQGQQQSQPGMKPNPAQGTSGGGTGPSIDDLITEARKTGNVKEAVRLESMKLLNLPQ